MDSPQLWRLRSVAMTCQDCSVFSVICWYARDFMRKVKRKNALAVTARSRLPKITLCLMQN